MHCRTKDRDTGSFIPGATTANTCFGRRRGHGFFDKDVALRRRSDQLDEFRAKQLAKRESRQPYA